MSSGAVHGVPSEDWNRIHIALYRGLRTLPRSRGLSRLLARERGARFRLNAPRLSARKILRLAEDHFQRTGKWPQDNSGPVLAHSDDTWLAIQSALQFGTRGLPGGDTLSRLLARNRGVRNRAGLPPLTIKKILRWADDHYRRFKKWPGQKSGPVIAAPGETWSRVVQALLTGGRGLPVKIPLGRLLFEQRGVRTVFSTPDLHINRILEWADAHHARHGHWPSKLSGPIEDAPGESWNAIHIALRTGTRGLDTGWTLSSLIRDRRIKRVTELLPRFSRPLARSTQKR